MEESLLSLTEGMPEDRKAVFARVWRRVMNSCAEESAPLSDPPAAQNAAASDPDQEEEAVRVPALPADCPCSDFPSGDGAGVLGENCLEFAGLLQEMIRRRLADWRSLQALARRAGGNPGRILAALAAEEKRQARELSAACFLITGARYWPDQEKPPRPGSYLAALRRRFRREQEDMASCLTAAELTADPCLRQLFLKHARESWDHACRIRSLVEQA